MTDRIDIRDLALRCIIGVNDDERRKKQDVVVNITLFADLHEAGRTDDIRHTVDYKAVKQQVVALVEQSSCFLVERLAEQIAATCLAAPRVRHVRVSVAKPGALRFARTVAVTLFRTRAAGT
ncbi:MAG: dihydroneopterin aldolase [Lentisphaerae bacterium]|nr:dihydroneopterin aldolase [Lentisphaerota bacterium]